MKPPIFVVVGICGEYSDQRQWLVTYFDTEALAQDHAVKAKEEAARCMAEARADDFDYSKPDPTNPLDPQCEWSYTGTDYTVVEVKAWP
jgi:roadblock/LC7 domain-containing protein